MNMKISGKKVQLAAKTSADPRWVDVVARNARADGKFYYAVRTTGVYCRPSCAAVRHGQRMSIFMPPVRKRRRRVSGPASVASRIGLP